MFEPWIGDLYGKSQNVFGGTSLLVLGESHYCNPQQPELVGQTEKLATIETVTELALEKSHRFFSVSDVLTAPSNCQRDQRVFAL